MNFTSTKTLKELQDAVFEVRREMDSIYNAAEKENRSLKADEQSRINELNRKHEDAEREYNERSRELEMKADMQNGILENIGADLRATKIRQAANDTTIGQLAKYLFRGGPMPKELEKRGVTSSSGATLIEDPVVMNNLIYALQANDPLAMAGAQYITMPNNARFPKLTAYPAAQWVGAEGTQVSDATPTISSVDFDYVDLAILVRVQNQALIDSSGRAERMVTEAIRRSISDAVLKAALYGAAGSNQPDGLDNISGVQTVDGNGNDITLGNHYYLLNAYRLLLDANVNAGSISMIANPVVWRQLTGQVDANAQPLMQPDGISPMSKYWTTAVKTNYGAGENYTTVYMGDFSQLVVAFQGLFEFRLVERYSDYLQTGFLAHLRVDIQALHPDNFCLIQNLSTTVSTPGN